MERKIGGMRELRKNARIHSGSMLPGLRTDGFLTAVKALDRLIKTIKSLRGEGI